MAWLQLWRGHCALMWLQFHSHCGHEECCNWTKISWSEICVAIVLQLYWGVVVIVLHVVLCVIMNVFAIALTLLSLRYMLQLSCNFPCNCNPILNFNMAAKMRWVCQLTICFFWAGCWRDSYGQARTLWRLAKRDSLSYIEADEGCLGTMLKEEGATTRTQFFLAGLITKWRVTILHGGVEIATA